MVQIEQRSLELAYDQEKGLSDQLLWSRLRAAASPADFAASWLEIQSRMLPPSRAGTVILGDPDKGGFAPLAVHPPGSIISADLAQAAQSALTERRGVLRERAASQRDDGIRCLAFPVMVDDTLAGVVAFELSTLEGDAGLAGRRLQWGAAWIELLVRRRTLLPSRRLSDAMDMVAGLMEAPRLKIGLQVFAGELAGLLGADWVAIGLVGRDDTLTTVDALSHTATIASKVQVVRAIVAAMQEALDQKEILRHPLPEGEVPLVVRAHDALEEIAGAGQMVSVPVAGDAAAVAVITLKRPPDRPFSQQETEFLRLISTFAGPAIDLKRRDDRPIALKVGEASWTGIRRLVGPGHTVLKLVAAGLVAVALALSLITWPDRVSAPAVLEGTIQRTVAAPVQGYVAAATVRAGDIVTEGQEIARLDSRDLDLERLRWLTERERWTREYRRAFASSERGDVGVLKARVEEAQARIDLVDEMLARMVVRAPLTGIVVRGDLERMLGAPVQRGDILFEIAPLDGYRVAIDVDERDVALIAAGQGGTLVLAGLPDTELPVTVTKITPVSRADEGRNVFRVEASLGGPVDILRPGMEGWAKVEIGERRLSRILSERALQWLRTTIWRWTP